MYDQFRRLLRHSTAYTVGNMVNRAFAIALVPIYTRFLTQADYGDLALLLAVTSILWVAFDFGMASAVTRFYYEYDEDRARRRFIGSMWLTLTVVAGGISLGLTLFGAAPLSRLLGGVAFWPYVAMTVWATFMNTANVIPKALMRVREQSSRFVALVFVQSALLLVTVFVFVVGLGMGLLGAVIAMFVQTACIYVFFTAYTLRNASLRPDWGAIGRALSFGAPILALEFGWWVLDTSDRFILRRYEAASVVALYAVGYALGRLLIMVSTSIDQAWTPFFFAAAKKDDAEARRMATYGATYFTLAVCAAGLPITVFARQAVLVFGGRDYLDAARVTPVIVLASIVQGMFYVPSRGLLMEKKTKVLPLIVLVSGATNVGLNFLLIPRYGMMGAAFATLMGYIVAVALTYLLSQHYYRIDYQVRRIATLLAIVLAGTAAAALVHPGPWPLGLAWQFGLLAAAATTLWFTGFFEPREIAAVRRLLKRRGRTGETSP